MKTDRRTTICIALAGDRLGGSHISLKGLLDRLPVDNFRILVIVEVPGGRIARYFCDFEQIEDPGALKQPFAVGRTFGIASFFRTLPGIISRARVLRAVDADIVHTNDGRSHASWALAAKIARVPIVWHHRGDPDARGTSFIAPLLADQIVGVSEYSLPSRRWGKLNRARVIHSPFDVEVSVDRAQMRRRLIDELQCPDNTIICGYVGQFIERKRPVGFIDTVAELAKIADRPVMGVMFGEAKDQALHAEMLERLNGGPDAAPVKLMGYREPGHDWIAACDALLVPALNEPLGRTLVEAMLVGTPVIASRSGGNPEALAPDCGIIVPPDDPAAMAKAAHSLLNSPSDYEQLTRRARCMAEKRYTSKKHVEQICAVYSDLVKKPRRSGLLLTLGT